MKIKLNKKLVAILASAGLVFTGCSTKTPAAPNPIIEELEDEIIDIKEEINEAKNEINKPQIDKEKDYSFNIPVYKTADDDHLIGFIISRDNLKVTRVDDEYAYVSNGEMEGYAELEDLYRLNVEISSENIMTREDLNFRVVEKTNDTVNFRKEPNMEGDVLNVIPNNTYIQVVRNLGEWSEILYGDVFGFVKSEYISTTYELNDNIKPIDHVYFPNETVIYSTPSFDTVLIPDMIEAYQMGEVISETKDAYFVVIDDLAGYVRKGDAIELDDTFITVDISDQEVRVYKDDELLLTSPCVTGKSSTPTDIGLHRIFKVRRNTVLQDAARTYSSYVDFMLNFNNGEGLHDAENITHTHSDGSTHTHGWRERDEFGGNTYINNGSHGCVNLPYETAEFIYNLVVRELSDEFEYMNITNNMELSPHEQIIKVLVKN